MIRVLAVAMAISGSAYAATGELVQLVCPMTNSDGQSTHVAELALDETNATVSVGALKEIPAAFSSASIRWTIQRRDSREGDFVSLLDRYTGEYTVSIVNPNSGTRLVILSGACEPASEEKRKF